MKKLYTILFSLAAISFVNATNFPGNGKTGFGGPVGTGSLDINNDGTNIQFKLNKGSGGFNDILVIYMDVDETASGYATTAAFTDVSSGLRKAISGYDDGAGNGRASFIFNSDFLPEFALAFGAGNNNGSELVQLVSGANHTSISTPTVAGGGSSNSASFTVVITAAQLGLSSTIGFKFIATYISPTAYRAEEAIGDPMTSFSQGWNSYTSVTSPLLYGELAPVVLNKFSGSISGTKATLQWDTKSESGTRVFEIQKRMNDATYQTIGSVNATNSINGAAYTYVDNLAKENKNYYRLKIIDFDGYTAYSNEILLAASLLKKIQLLGNPVKDKLVLKISEEKQAQYTIKLYGTAGISLGTLIYNHTGGEAKIAMSVPAGYSGAAYIVITNGNASQTLNAIVE